MLLWEKIILDLFLFTVLRLKVFDINLNEIAHLLTFLFLVQADTLYKIKSTISSPRRRAITCPNALDKYSIKWVFNS